MQHAESAPAMTTSPDHSRRAVRWVACAFAAYPAYLLLLGPFWAMDGRGYIPERASRFVWAPALACRAVPVVSWVLQDYLDGWYVDPRAGETTR